MSSLLRTLVFVFVGFFASLAAGLAIEGDIKAAAGAFIPMALVLPLLLEAWRPGKYVLRKPADGSPDNLLNRMKQFRIDHPGTDGTLILGGFVTLASALVAISFVSLIRAFFS